MNATQLTGPGLSLRQTACRLHCEACGYDATDTPGLAARMPVDLPVA